MVYVQAFQKYLTFRNWKITTDLQSGRYRETVVFQWYFCGIPVQINKKVSGKKCCKGSTAKDYFGVK